MVYFTGKKRGTGTAYLLKFEWFDGSDRTTSDGFSGGPEGWKQTSYKFKEKNDIATTDKAIKIIEKTGYRRLKNIEL